MAFIYRTRQYQSSIENDLSNISEEVEKRLRDLELRVRLRPVGKLRNFGETNILVLTLVNKLNSRTLIEKRYVNIEGEDHEICFARLFIPTSNMDKWERHHLPLLKSNDWLSTYPLPEEELKDGILEYKEKLYKSSNAQKQPVPHKLSKWAESINQIDVTSDFRVYETSDWVSFSSPIKEGGMDLGNMNSYRALLEKVLTGKIESEEVVPVEAEEKVRTIIGDEERVRAISEEEAFTRRLYLASDAGVAVLYERFQEGTEDIILLHNGGVELEGKTLQFTMKDSIESAKYLTIPDIDKYGYTLSGISRAASRAYPYHVVKDTKDKSWRKLQLNREDSNLALVPEQISLLQEITFPKFINGQAGSGKSTMLYYLFAKAYYASLIDKELDNSLLFLTENQELLDNAYHTISNLLKYNATFRLAGELESASQLNKLKGCFHTFSDFIYHKLLPEEDQELFPKDDEAEVTYTSFKKWYLKTNVPRNGKNQARPSSNFSTIPNHIVNKYSPEKVWFVITTFIKGYDKSYFVEPQHFIDGTLKKNDKTQGVSKEEFKEIYEQIWLPHYSKYTAPDKTGVHRRWDKWDLVRHVLNTYWAFPKRYSVVFCDEAQDFSRLELELIIRLSAFTEYDLSSIKQIPILLAGDPFQTVNPTGFNINRVKDLTRDLLQNLNFKEDIWGEFVQTLNYNHRSAKPIVDFSNLIQFIRRFYLNKEGIQEPQSPKVEGSTLNIPVLYKLYDKQDSEKSTQADLIKEVYKLDRIIPPCDNQEEDSYIENDWLLDGKSGVVKSAIAAKGNEYPKVICYKFGDYFMNSLIGKQMNTNTDRNLFEELLQRKDDFESSFFFNKLYVCITRAQKELIILDTQSGIEGFWRVLLSSSNITKELEQRGGKLWEEAILKNTYSSQGTENDVILAQQIFDQSELTKSKFSDYEESAQRDLKQGILLEDTDLLGTAKYVYERLIEMCINADKLGETEDAVKRYRKQQAKCNAYIHWFNKEYNLAGEAFVKQRLFKEAIKAFWQGGEWGSICHLYEEGAGDVDEELISTLKEFNEVANFMLESNIDVANKICENKHSLLPQIRSQSWKADWLETIYQRITYRNELSKVTRNSLADTLLFFSKEMSLYQDEYKNKVAKYFWSEGNRLEDAVNLWEETGTVDHSDYYAAKISLAESSGDVEQEIVYRGLRNIQNEERQIIDRYEKHSEQITDKDVLKVVYNSYLALGKYSKCLDWDGLTPKILFNTSVKESTKSTMCAFMNVLDALDDFYFQSYPQEPIAFFDDDFFNELYKVWVKVFNSEFKPSIYNFKQDIPIPKLKYDEKKQALKLICKFIAFSKLNPEKDEMPRKLRAIIHFARHLLLEEYKSNISNLIILATALERTDYTFANILPFYDTATLSVKESEWKTFASKRWAKVKYKQLNIEARAESKETSQLEFNWEDQFKRFREKHQISNVLELDWKKSGKLPNYPKAWEEITPLQAKAKNSKEYISCLRLKNFKLLKYLEVSNLGRFNLVLGDNNTGKTTLLESLLVTDSLNTYYQSLASLIAMRNGQVQEKELEISPDILFKDFTNLSENSNDTGFFSISIDRSGIEKRWRMEENRLYLYIDEKDGPNSPWSLPYDNNKVQLLNSDATFPFIPFGKTFGGHLASIYEDVTTASMEADEHFENALKIFIPNLNKVKTKGERILIGEKGHREFIELKNYGEGVNKLFKILLHIASNPNGVVLIDEIDAGIHFTRFPLFWKTIMYFASPEQYNVQIFATTHNEECIEYFKEVLEENEQFQEESRIITLAKNVDTQNIIPIVSEFEDFQYAIDQKRNLRGGGL